MTKPTSTKKRSQLLKPKKSGDVPVTKRHLDLVKQELKSSITSCRLETKAVKLDVKAVKLEVNSLRLEMKAGFAKVDSRFEKIEATLFEMKAILEEQNSRNRIVLDGYAGLFDKQISNDKRIGNLEKKVFGIQQK